MTRYGWDASNHDWPRGAMDLARARRDGIALFTHKASEGTSFTDPYVDDAMARGRSVFSVLGTYHVLWPQNTAAQTDHWIAVTGQSAPWWRDHPCFVWQIDAELFQNFTPYRPPTVAEINACGDRLVALLGINPERVVVYAPKWLYQDGLRGLKYRLWASAYVTGSGGFKALYPGDGNNRWDAYSGLTPTILQFTSSATIAGQSPTDANAIKVGSDAALQALFLGTPGGTDMALDAETQAYFDQKFAAMHDEHSLIIHGDSGHPNSLDSIRSTQDAYYSDTKHQFSNAAIVARQAQQMAASVTDSELATALTGFLPTVTQAVTDAIAGGTTDTAGIAQLVVTRIAELLKGASA